MDVAYIILGWLLGILSPVIASKISRRYKKNGLYSGISKEINHVKKRLVLTLDIISHRTGSYDRELVSWLLKQYENLKTRKPVVVKSYQMQLEASAKEFEAMKIHQATPDNKGLTVQKFQLLFINMHLIDFSLFSSEFQSEIFELKSRIEILNSEISLAERYFFMTFDSNISTVNQSIIKQDLTHKYRHIETMIKRAVEQIEIINETKKIYKNLGSKLPSF